MVPAISVLISDWESTYKHTNLGRLSKTPRNSGPPRTKSPDVSAAAGVREIQTRRAGVGGQGRGLKSKKRTGMRRSSRLPFGSVRGKKGRLKTLPTAAYSKSKDRSSSFCVRVDSGDDAMQPNEHCGDTLQHPSCAPLRVAPCARVQLVQTC